MGLWWSASCSFGQPKRARQFLPFVSPANKDKCRIHTRLLEDQDRSHVEPGGSASGLYWRLQADHVRRRRDLGALRMRDAVTCKPP